MLVRCNYNSKRGNRFSEERDRKGRVIRPGIGQETKLQSYHDDQTKACRVKSGKARREQSSR